MQDKLYIYYFKNKKKKTSFDSFNIFVVIFKNLTYIPYGGFVSVPNPLTSSPDFVFKKLIWLTYVY